MDSLAASPPEQPASKKVFISQILNAKNAIDGMRVWISGIITHYKADGEKLWIVSLDDATGTIRGVIKKPFAALQEFVPSVGKSATLIGDIKVQSGGSYLNVTRVYYNQSIDAMATWTLEVMDLQMQQG